MRAFTALSLALSLALSVAPAVASADSHAFVARSHGRRHPGVSRVEARGLEKRFDNARFTYYADGLGACGKSNQPSDFIVALNSAVSLKTPCTLLGSSV
ncbi:hypothetical protein EWM64_g5642 [Hericium alpestre]|uniref:Uncharacterized protein n=1 Tax=Hericium alpestre TaxID=135208 RepID=A0A4Y9ZU89_9AGAM|nr:hypothetical protein EWM64_g5642 [Hericium alpestre]